MSWAGEGDTRQNSPDPRPVFRLLQTKMLCARIKVMRSALLPANYTKICIRTKTQQDSSVTMLTAFYVLQLPPFVRQTTSYPQWYSGIRTDDDFHHTYLCHCCLITPILSIMPLTVLTCSYHCFLIHNAHTTHHAVDVFIPLFSRPSCPYHPSCP